MPSGRVLLDAYDGFMNPAPWSCNFRNPQLSADDKIYMGSYGGCKNLHVVNHPERAGLACNFKQHGISLCTFHKGGGLPNVPNYRLGSIDGSICDSLGIDNIPIAAFRYDVDRANRLSVDFTDLSDYEPAGWLWDFGDGHTSTEKYSVHTYDSAGTYQICPTVSNVNGSDTYCKTVQLGTIGAVDVPEVSNFIHYSFETAELMIQDTRLKNIHITDPSGRNIMNINDFIGSVDPSSLKSGCYFWRALDHNGRLRTGKFVKIQFLPAAGYNKGLRPNNYQDLFPFLTNNHS